MLRPTDPNHMACSFKTGSVPVIRVLLPSVNNPIYGTLAREIEAVANNDYGFGFLLAILIATRTRKEIFCKTSWGTAFAA